MKKQLLIVLLLGINFVTKAQNNNVGIGTSNPDASAVLELDSKNKGLLIPRMGAELRLAINNPADGLLVYQTNQKTGFYFYDASRKDWRPLTTELNSVAGTDGDWVVNGSTSLPVGSFIGSDQPFIIKRYTTTPTVGFKNLATIDNARIFIGIEAGNNNTGGDNLAIGGYALNPLGSTGYGNIALGNYSLNANTSGFRNVGIGQWSLRNNTTGQNNLAFGFSSLLKNTVGNDNIVLGSDALTNKILGSGNIAIGSQAGFLNTNGGSNVLIGHNAGRSSTAGLGNIFLGYQAGYSELGNNLLYIANSNTTNPLIKGDFANSVVKIHTGISNPTASTGFMAIGNFSANGTTNTPGTGGINTFPAFTGTSKFRLVVQDGILTEEVKIALRNSSDWADYVFDSDYKLKSLQEVETFLKQNKHLPNVPSAEEIVSKGMSVSETSKMFMEKIEELTLYIIEMNKKIETLEKNQK